MLVPIIGWLLAHTAQNKTMKSCFRLPFHIVFIIIKPGSTTKNDLAKKIATLMNISIAEIHQLLPSGKSDISEIHGYTNQNRETP